MMPTLIVITGPTGVGKTELSVQVAEHFDTCILSADSRQIFKDLHIGTSAPTQTQLTRVPHYFIGSVKLTDYYSAAKYEEEAITLLTNLFKQHRYVVLTGGSMMYVDAVCNGIDDMPTIDPETRQFICLKLQKEGLDSLCRELKLLDPEYYHQVDIKNPKRIVHALEICYMTGRTYTSYRTQSIKRRPFEICKIGLTRPKDELYQRINTRVEQMLEQGLLEEVKALLPYRGLNSLNTVGYKEIFNYLDGIWNLPFAIEKIKQHTRVYSRKQISWLKKDPSIKWFHPSNKDEIMDYILSHKYLTDHKE